MQMPRLAPQPVELDNEERQELAKILARHSTSQQIAKRAKIILLASQEKNHRAIARELEISRKMARLWRERWLELKKKDVPVRERLLDMDCLNIHFSESLVRWIASLSGISDLVLGKKGQSGILESMATRAEFLSQPEHKVVFYYTPKHCSW